jgi:hypothetical protein
MLKDERCCKKEQTKTEEDLPVGLLTNKKKVTCLPRNGGWSVQVMVKYTVLVAHVQQEDQRLNFTVDEAYKILDDTCNGQSSQDWNHRLRCIEETSAVTVMRMMQKGSCRCRFQGFLSTGLLYFELTFVL